MVSDLCFELHTFSLCALRVKYTKQGLPSHVSYFTVMIALTPTVFIEDDGYMRAEDMICEVPSGRVNVRTGLAIGCFVLGLLAPVLWVTFLIIIKLCRNTDFPDG